jgi:decaprenylphospho-beta-D-erythro-pentofuranosid-2-ulose 2-reductase
MTEGLKPPPLSATPDEVADAVVAGIRKGTTVVWVPGPMRWLMVVIRHLPRPLFRRLPF